ncbi:MAG: hypothetical protein ACLUUO_10410 [Sellimonas intestinalis]
MSPWKKSPWTRDGEFGGEEFDKDPHPEPSAGAMPSWYRRKRRIWRLIHHPYKESLKRRALEELDEEEEKKF